MNDGRPIRAATSGRLGATGNTVARCEAMRPAMEELGWRYRQASADLALARRDYPTEPTTRYLNGLVARAERRLYVPRRDGVQAVLDFYSGTFPRLFRQTFRYTLAAFLLCFVAFLASYTAVLVRPSLVEAFAPGSSDADRSGEARQDVVRRDPR